MTVRGILTDLVLLSIAIGFSTMAYFTFQFIGWVITKIFNRSNA